MKIILSTLVSLLLLIVTFIPTKSHAEDLLKVVNDPATAKALKTFNKKMQKIGSECNKQGKPKDMRKALDCMCDNMPEIMKANQIKINAFLDLMKRRPDLVNEMVKIEGVFGNWYLDPDDPAMKRGDDLSYWKKKYNCK